ncbi:uncharacterized protein FOMMEDRAFT_171009 [Fomitiporia mediterranea MF3/22]|uniref:uncharacterized protein n=1 Tax=Fomitiporia mediterranea (strain MF3/22) TaxID=694068 RepID=UPI00044083B2|nr:uncharacterized protein FOMMEDRAFT_171009 [Fomitiporia mediterranea MF3/22]EJC98826.1 hypothetical protein FOMMEDRAFT_171009 [Fomitiporia mediterranea MF3/22]
MSLFGFFGSGWGRDLYLYNDCDGSLCTLHDQSSNLELWRIHLSFKRREELLTGSHLQLSGFFPESPPDNFSMTQVSYCATRVSR